MKPKIKFLLLALLFVAPLVAAWLVFFVYPEWQPQGRLNYGTLISPARPLPDLTLVTMNNTPFTTLKGKWTLVYLGADACDETCTQRLLLTRQVRLALNQNRDRVQRVYLAPTATALAAVHPQLMAEHPDLLFAADAGAAGVRATDFFQPTDPNAVYLLDPLGNWLMVYPGEIQAKGLHRDLKKLLRFSQVG